MSEAPTPTPARRHLLRASAETTVVGVIDAARPPVLTVDSGDEVEFDAPSMWGGEIRPTTTLAEFLELRERHRAAGALGPHTLTGPIAVRGAAPGDALRIDLLELEPGEHAINLRLPGAGARGALADAFPAGELRHYPIDRAAGTVEVLPGVRLPLRPFLGVLGVAPAADGPHPSGRPGRFGGNVDCRHLTAGTSLRLPVLRPGAGFYAGDAHALQGDGEVNQTAIETAMARARLRLTVEPGAAPPLPQVETVDAIYALAFGESLDDAARAAVAAAVDLIVARTGVTPGAAYAACSAAVDLAVTQMVNGTVGVHARVPRALLAAHP